MRHPYHPVVAIGAATSVVAGIFTPAAAADSAVPLGGGAGITVNGTPCTLTTIGHDRSGALVGFTAGHCGGPGADVVAEGANNGTVGSVTTVGDGLDYAVIKFDPAKVSPTASFAGFPVTSIGSDPDWHQHVCMNGAANGLICGGVASMPGPGPRGGMSHALFQPGDDGAPLTTDGRLVGVAFGGLNAPGDLQGLAPSNFTDFTKFSAIVNDVNAKGGPGAGFTPI
jgi:hypothetical protein